MDVLRKERGDAGQATVELAVVLPVAIVLAVIVVNALSFFEACAAFDQLARQAICAYAPSPDAGQGPAEVAALVESELEGALGTSNLAIEVTVQGRAGSYQRYCGRLSFAPTLFGLGLKDEVFGVSLPRLVHEVDLTVDALSAGGAALMGAGKTWRRRFGCALALVLAPLLALALGQPMGEAMLPGRQGSLSPTSVCARRGRPPTGSPRKWLMWTVARSCGPTTTGRWSPSLRRGTACPIASLASWRDAGGHW